MIPLGNIGPDAIIKGKSIYPVLFHALRRYLNHHMGTAGIYHLPQIHLQLHRIRCGIVQLMYLRINDRSIGTDGTGTKTGTAEHICQHMSGSGFSFRSSYANGSQLLCRIPVPSTCQKGQYLPRIFHLNHCRMCHPFHRMFCDNQCSPLLINLLYTVMGVKSGSLNADKYISCLHLTVVMRDTRHFSICFPLYPYIRNAFQQSCNFHTLLHSKFFFS